MSQPMMSVSSLNTKIKSLLEATFMHILVEGEVASVTYHTSGHVYFAIKDSESSIRCVMWRSNVAKMKFRLEQGMHVVIEGSVGVYTPRGEYQFYAVKIEPYGQGALALAYEQLKERLKAKGYFDITRKKTVPKIIQKLVLVTAKESAALHDMLKIIQKRWPLLEVVIVDTLVQGENAAPQIARALTFADRLEADVVVVGRGGGSTEDLWAFNEEIVADTIYAMNTPVVSAVGHEVDVMISDFVADLRAPTPSAAMEMILPDVQEIMYALGELQERYRYIWQEKIAYKERALAHHSELILRSSPLRKLEETNRTYEQLKNEFQRAINRKFDKELSLLPEIQKTFLQNIEFVLQNKRELLGYLAKRFEMIDPKKQYKKGWAQVSYKGTSISLDKLKIDQTFILEDQTSRVEALCLNKLELDI
ncbi:exodeoxyribonuclease VII large subunit [Sulfurovum sp. zt1-1]|uniref:Exodeoxyribonuclease 7 large subunit n=1 Tax=Sulfurovum zhangzhouensis TaxID=3019067 RepID=A0ABT7QWS4_9BACT|nr:exodeoxyribonuclease VII large subunit [Sulfurovum zhangzhouensis]MDM5271287.1 exodeoxyribonuclease VII large subunit [Sulfurovum zhangzhouensis]